jgi:hypothetical protein
MLATLDRHAALETLADEHFAVRAFLNALSDEEQARPNTIRLGLYPEQQMSIKDLMAHLITWELIALDNLAEWQRGEKPSMTDPARSTYEAGRQINFEGIAKRYALTPAEVRDELYATQDRLRTAIESLSDTAWTETAPYPTDDEIDLGGLLEEILTAPGKPRFAHFSVHVPDAAQFLATLRETS